MNRKIALVFVVIFILTLGLSACERSANPTVVVPATAPGVVVAPATDNVMGRLGQFVTQTAMAQNGGKPATPAPGQPTAVGQKPPAGQPTAAGAKPPAALPTAPAPAIQPTQPPSPLPTAAPKPTAVTGPIPTLTRPASYTMQTDEFPYCIARRFNVDPVALLSANGLGPNSFIRAGMVVNIPQNAGQFPGARALKNHPDTYTVRGGESLSAIACGYGDVSPEAIIAANGLTAPYSFKAGQELKIP
jgi:LysM repeat protein